MSSGSDRGMVVGVDVGASGIRAKLDAAGGPQELHSELPIPRLRGRVDIERLSTAIVTGIREAAGGPGRVDVVCVGMAGLPDLVDAPATLAGLIARGLDDAAVVLAGDAVTTHVGALGLATGTVIAAGTGVVALGTDHHSLWHRADGWGVLLGDEGGGAWIGRHGLVAALRAHDGREGGSATLHARMLADFGRPDEVVDAVYGAESPSYLLGRFAPIVAAAALEGDEIARGIWQEAGTLLARTALAASSEVGDDFSWSGGLFDAGELLLEPFHAALRAHRPGARLVPPAGTSADGALRLAHAYRDSGRASRPPFIEVYRFPQRLGDTAGS